MTKSKKYFILFLFLLIPGLLFVLLSQETNKSQPLPYYGFKEIDLNGDTLYHKVPDFEYINQYGEGVSFANFENKIIVADFFFTTCPTICPIMTKEMARLQEILDAPDFKDVVLLSHTVNPKHDTPEVLLEYAKEHHADLTRWTFVTGDQEEIHKQGFYGYLLNTQEDAAAPGGFLHSGSFILLDKDRHIRGIYDGTNSKDVDKLATDIKMLKKEEKKSA